MLRSRHRHNQRWRRYSHVSRAARPQVPCRPTSPRRRGRRRRRPLPRQNARRRPAARAVAVGSRPIAQGRYWAHPIAICPRQHGLHPPSSHWPRVRQVPADHSNYYKLPVRRSDRLKGTEHLHPSAKVIIGPGRFPLPRLISAVFKEESKMPEAEPERAPAASQSPGPLPLLTAPFKPPSCGARGVR